jgi:N-acetylneuraminic acid mutarotase
MNSGGQFDYSIPDTSAFNLNSDATDLLAFSAGRKAYAFLGGVFWEFNTETNAWTKRAPFPGILEKENRSVFGIFVKDKLYLGNCGTRSDFWEYNPASNSWSRKADFKTNFPNNYVYGNFAFALADKLYLAVTTDNNTCKLYTYEPSSNTWTAKGNLPYQPWFELACFVLYDVAYVGLGHCLYSDQSLFFKYSVSTDRWSELRLHPNLGNLIVDAVFPINGKAYWVIPNWYNSSFYENWEYDPTVF